MTEREEDLCFMFDEVSELYPDERRSTLLQMVCDLHNEQTGESIDHGDVVSALAAREAEEKRTLN